MYFMHNTLYMLVPAGHKYNRKEVKILLLSIRLWRSLPQDQRVQASQGIIKENDILQYILWDACFL